MAIHFTREELASRQRAARSAMTARGLDGLLMFRQESMYYLTGYDTFGFVYFQCLFLGADGTLTLLTRAPDLRQARHTSIIEDIRVWIDREGANPARDLRQVLEEHGMKGCKIGVEYEAYGLTGRSCKLLEAALEGFCALDDASELISRLRLVKSAAELAYVRRAAELADAGLEAARRLAVPGAFEGDILAEMQGAVFRGDGDYPGNEFIMGSGRDALLVRYFAGRRRLEGRDQLSIEWAGVYRHYHACMMRALLIGEPAPEHLAMYDAVREALAACEETLKPGVPMGEVFDAHARVLDRAGYHPHRLNACGYSLGTTFAPNWMDWPMLYHGNPVLAAPGMVFFLHMVLLDSDNERAMSLGRTVVVTEDGCESLSKAPIDLIQN